MVGHKQQQEFFVNSYNSNQLAHAYLLSGTEGIGKKLFAKEFAMGMLCSNKSFFKNCDCPSCKQIREDSHPDFYLFESKKDPKQENQLNIKSVRKVADISDMTSYRGGWKILIFDDVHQLSHGSGESGNALLKTLEEPGENTLFLLISHKPEKVLSTIKSRCLTVNFNDLNTDELQKVVCGLEPTVEWERIIPYAGGSASKAAFLQEQNISVLIEALDNKNLTAIGESLLNITDKNILQASAEVLLNYFVTAFKKEENNNYMYMVEYLKEFLFKMDYNININIQLLELYTKISGAFEL